MRCRKQREVSPIAVVRTGGGGDASAIIKATVEGHRPQRLAARLREAANGST